MYSSEELWESDFQLRNHIIDLFLLSNKENQIEIGSINTVRFMLQKLNRQQLIDTLIYIQRIAER